MSLILGLDISSTRSGWAVLDASKDPPRLVVSGIVKQKRSDKDSMGLRLERLADALIAVLKGHAITSAVLEAGYLKYGIAMLKIAEARGVALLCCQGARVPVQEVPPAQWRKRIAGKGNTDKVDAQQMLRLQVQNLPDAFASDDESDAIACALYGALLLTDKAACPI